MWVIDEYSRYLGYRIRTRNNNNKKGWAIKRRPIEIKVKIT